MKHMPVGKNLQTLHRHVQLLSAKNKHDAANGIKMRIQLEKSEDFDRTFDLLFSSRLMLVSRTKKKRRKKVDESEV